MQQVTLYGYGGTVIDYLPSDGLLEREDLYRYNQIPAVVLEPKDFGQKDWHQELYDRLQRTYQKAFDVEYI